MNDSLYIEIEHYQRQKSGQMACGDVFFSRKSESPERFVSVLADGLGSGVKANVLATLTTTMVSNLIANDIDIKRAAAMVSETLPVCKIRKIGYSTFSIIDIDRTGRTRIIENDNPPFILVRSGVIEKVEKKLISTKAYNGRDMKIYYSSFQAKPGDMIIVFSDGVSQSGIGSEKYPLGWENSGVEEFVGESFQRNPQMTARELARRVVNRAYSNDDKKALDDITCGVIHVRRAVETMVFTGPPFNMENDGMLAKKAGAFKGRKIICGGTTAGILAREMNLDVHVDISALNDEIPPVSMIKGFDLVTEGTITLGRVSTILENGEFSESPCNNAAGKLSEQLLDSDIITFIVGTRINESHQDPCLPRELDIRRNIIRKIAEILERKYLKKVVVEYI